MVSSNRKISKNCEKSEQGITLIVLIVTIVVLLILAGITIANITGGDGIIEQASNKKDEATIANEKQILSNAVITASNKSKFGEITENNLREALINKNVDILKSGGLYRITFKDTNNLYKMNKDGEFFAWEDMEPTDIYWRFDTTSKILYLRATSSDSNGNTYITGTPWRDSYASSVEKVIIEEPIAPSNCTDMFYDCRALMEIENIKYLHTENTTSMYQMFRRCSSLEKIELKYFDTSNVETMKWMFLNCTKLKELNLDSFDTTNVKNMNGMFYSSNLTSLDLKNFDTTNVEDMRNMFYNCPYLQKIYVSNKFIVKQDTLSDEMFLYSYKLTGGNGTPYDENNTDKTYARIDDPDNEKPGYFTYKEN